MLTAAQRARLAVVLVGARNPSNIGAAARALQDFGFSDLRVVNSFASPFEAAQLAVAGTGLEPVKAAVGAADVMRTARRYDTLAEAIADRHLVVGTTAVGERGLELPVLPLRECAAPVLTELQADEAHGGQVALLFGSEKTGLTREQLSFCSLLLTIPLFQPEGGRHLSMNLGQSVAVTLYELTREGLEGARALPAHDEVPSTVADRERLHTLLLAVMSRSGYSRRFPANARAPVVRQLVQHTAATHLEAATWMGILRQMLKHLPGAEADLRTDGAATIDSTTDSERE